MQEISEKGKNLIIHDESIASKVPLVSFYKGENTNIPKWNIPALAKNSNGGIAWNKINCNQEDIKNNVKVYPYVCSGGKYTIGIGCVIGKGEYETGILVNEAIKLFEIKLKDYYPKLNVNLNQNQFDALVSLCYNIGVGAFNKSTLKKTIETNITNKELIKTGFLAYKFAGGVENEGLLRRREAEYNLFIS